MLFDTDVLIWHLRGHVRATGLLARSPERAISVVSYMELLQGARDKREAANIRSFLATYDFRTIPLTENVGHRASIYVEGFGLQTGIDTIDALVAATAVENGLTLCTANQKHYRAIRDLDLRTFRP